jgi:hypothetical protein
MNCSPITERSPLFVSNASSISADNASSSANRSSTPIRYGAFLLDTSGISNDQDLITNKDIDSHAIATTIASVMHPDKLESMVLTAVYREVEKQVQSFF